MDEKRYVILGNNNFWYSTFVAKSMEEIAIEVQQVQKDLHNYTQAPSVPTRLYVYEANLLHTVKLTEDE